MPWTFTRATAQPPTPGRGALPSVGLARCAVTWAQETGGKGALWRQTLALGLWGNCSTTLGGTTSVSADAVIPVTRALSSL